MVDSFAWFCTSNEDKEFLLKYSSPEDEASFFKNIPIQHLDRVKKILKPMGQFRVIYRGPRGHYRDQSMTWKENANRFSIYQRY